MDKQVARPMGAGTYLSGEAVKEWKWRSSALSLPSPEPRDAQHTSHIRKKWLPQDFSSSGFLSFLSAGIIGNIFIQIIVMGTPRSKCQDSKTNSLPKKLWSESMEP